MILFKQEHVQPILDGRKTQTRRRISKRIWKIGTIHQAKTGYQKDKLFAHIQLIAFRRERLGDISHEDAVREGYNSIAEYIEVYIQIYGSWEPDELVWVIDFERIRDLT